MKIQHLLFSSLAFCLLAFTLHAAPPPGTHPVTRPVARLVPSLPPPPSPQDPRLPRRGMTGTFLPDRVQGWAGLEVRIHGVLAAVTDSKGTFTLPPTVAEGTPLQFAVKGHPLFRAPAAPGMKLPAGPFHSGGGGNVYGTVFDEDGPLSAALVIVTDGTEYAFDLSGSSGGYTVDDPPAGDVLVVALAELHQPYLEAIHLDPGQSVAHDLFLEKAPGLGKLYGRALTPAGIPLSGVYVNYAQPGGAFREDITNIYGMYELLDIPAGLGLLSAAKEGYHDFQMGRWVSPGFNEQDIPMTPVLPGTVTGTVRTPAGDPVPGALLRLTFHKLDGSLDWMFTWSVEQGIFAFGDVPPGGYVVQSFIPGWLPGAAAGTVFEGQVSEEILVMEPNGGTDTLEGLVLDFTGTPVPWAFGYVTYLGFEQEVSGWVTADEHGVFHVEGLPYGPYAVRIETAAFLPAMAFSDLLPGQHVPFLEMVYPFDPSLAGALGGRVFSQGGLTVPFAVVGCEAVSNGAFTFKTFSDPLGRYLFPFLPPDAFQAFAFHPDYGFGTGFGQVETGAFTELDLVLD